MNIPSFCEQYKVNPEPDVDDELIVQGKWGQVYKYSSKLFGCMFMPDPEGEARSSKKWAGAKKLMVKNKFTIQVDCDGEGIGLFDPEEKGQARAALKVIGYVRHRKGRVVKCRKQRASKNTLLDKSISFKSSKLDPKL